MQYFSLPLQILFLLPEASTADHHFCFGLTASFFLELLVIALCFYPVAYWTHSNLGAHPLVSLPYPTVHEAFQARILEWIVISSPVDHILSELFTVTHPSCVALHGMVPSFIDLHKPFHHDKAVIHEQWTHMGKDNRDDGIPLKVHAWKWHTFLLPYFPGQIICLKHDENWWQRDRKVYTYSGNVRNYFEKCNFLQKWI